MENINWGVLANAALERVPVVSNLLELNGSVAVEDTPQEPSDDVTALR